MLKVKSEESKEGVRCYGCSDSGRARRDRILSPTNDLQRS